MPYLVKDRDHMARIRDQIVYPILVPEAEKVGYRIIGVWENGFRQITNNKHPIVKPADLEGIKLRVPQGVWRVKMFKAYGANPTPLAFSEVFVALQTGVMDGAGKSAGPDLLRPFPGSAEISVDDRPRLHADLCHRRRELVAAAGRRAEDSRRHREGSAAGRPRRSPPISTTSCSKRSRRPA